MEDKKVGKLSIFPTLISNFSIFPTALFNYMHAPA